MRVCIGRFVYRALTASAVFLLLLLSTGQLASAAELREGDIVTIGTDQIVDDDLYIFGSSVIIDGTVTGDVFSAGGQVTIHGIVDGSINAAGGSVNVTGRVGRAVRVVGSTLQFSGEAGGDLVAVGADVVVADGGSVGGEAILSATRATIDGSVGRNVRGSVGDLTLAGPVGGDVDVQVDRLTLAGTAAIEGDLTYTSSVDAQGVSNGQVGGGITRKEPTTTQMGWNSENWWWQLLLLVWAFALGATLILLAPSSVESVARSVRDRPWSSLAFGVLAIILTPFAILVLGITLVGLPLAAILLVAFLLALYLSQVFVGLAIGQWIIGNLLPGTGRWALIGGLAVGLIVLNIFTSLPLPVVGGVVTLAVMIAGLGALTLNIGRLGFTPRQTPTR